MSPHRSSTVAHTDAVTSRALAVDFGTARTKVSDVSGMVRVDHPTLLSRDRRGRVRVGWEAWVSSAEHGDGTVLQHPIRHALVADPTDCVQFLRAILPKARGPVALAIPAAASRSDAAVLGGVLRSAVGATVLPVDTLVAGAIGAGLPLHDPAGVLICDVGVGIIEVGVVSSWPDGVPALIARASADVGVATYEDDATFFLDAARDALRRVLEQRPDPGDRPASDRWLHLIGGGAVLPGLAEDLTVALRMKVAVPVDPRHVVISGLVRALSSASGSAGRQPTERLQTEPTDLATALRTRSRIGMAVGVLMSLYRCTAEEAFELLTSTGNDLEGTVCDLAEQVLLTGALPEVPWSIRY